MFGLKSFASMLKTAFLFLLAVGALVTSFGSGFPSWIGTRALMATMLLLLATIFAFGVRSALGIAIVGAGLIGLDILIWYRFRQPAPVGKELGAGLALMVFFICGLVATSLGSGLDWLWRTLYHRSKRPAS
jgi:hypothetical protein